jgi:carbamate kinase
MRIIVAIDGELLVSSETDSSIAGQRDQIHWMIENLGPLLAAEHEFVIIHGNAPQVGFVLLRSEIASHAVYALPLDICGADTQGATGYLLQQAIRNWTQQHNLDKEVVTVVTQVLVDWNTSAVEKPTRGIGPYFDREKAQLYASSRNWQFVLMAGQGYRRAVPALRPVHVLETHTIERLLNKSTIVICAGGGGIPVRSDESGQLHGVEAVVDKAFTAQLLATEIAAEAIVFVTTQSSLETMLKRPLDSQPECLSIDQIRQFMAQHQEELSDDIKTKLMAGYGFLHSTGAWVLITGPGALQSDPAQSGGLLIVKEGVGVSNP